MPCTLKTTKVLLLSVLTFELLLVSCNGKPNGRLEENRERTALENYFLIKNDRRMYSIFLFIRAEGLIPRRLRRNMRVLKPTATTL